MASHGAAKVNLELEWHVDPNLSWRREQQAAELWKQAVVFLTNYGLKLMHAVVSIWTGSIYKARCLSTIGGW